jgi:5-methylthioribose kinase
MIELTTETLVHYLRERGHIGPGEARAEELGGGVSNVVFQVWSGDGPIVVKQSRPRLRTKAAWFSDTSRIHREEEAQRLLCEALPGQVPRVLFSEPADCLFGMERVPGPCTPWKRVLLDGALSEDVAWEAGVMLRRIHEVKPPAHFADRTVFRQLRTDPFYRAAKAHHPDLSSRLEELACTLETAEVGFCHADFTPKNLLLGPRLHLVDHETCHLGDPAMDVGLISAHLWLKGARQPGQAAGFQALISQLLAGHGDADSQRRALPHLGACLLARVDGTSPVEYLTDEQRDRGRQVGRAILQDRIRSWDEAVGMLGR